MARGRVEIDLNRCKACELCVKVCPVKILRLSERINDKGFHPVEVSVMEKCIGCAMCATVCPDVVFTVYKDE